MPNAKRIKLDTLKPAPYNPREIDDAALDGLAATIADTSAEIRGKAGKPYRIDSAPHGRYDALA